MKRVRNFFFFAVLALCLVVNPRTTAKANEVCPIQELQTKLKAMSIEELNQFIDELYSLYQDQIENPSIDQHIENQSMASMYLDPICPLCGPTYLEQAWIAAAEVADKAGYPCSAALIKSSVLNKPYSEQGQSGLFIDKIKVDRDYLNYMNGIQGVIKPVSGSFNFNSGDLFFALHSVDIFTNPGYPYVSVTITDTYDFKYENYDRIFVDIVNNWAWLSQNAGALKKIPVTISFYK